MCVTYCRHPSPIQTVLSAPESHQILHSLLCVSSGGSRAYMHVARSPPVGNFTLPRRNVWLYAVHYTAVHFDLTIADDRILHFSAGGEKMFPSSTKQPTAVHIQNFPGNVGGLGRNPNVSPWKAGHCRRISERSLAAATVIRNTLLRLTSITSSQIFSASPNGIWVVTAPLAPALLMRMSTTPVRSTTDFTGMNGRTVSNQKKSGS